MGANTKYKASVFSSLFSHPDILRELYSALEGVAIPPDVPVTINTLDNVLYMGRLNDISFSLGDKQVVLIEHQSTINPNMPLRLLIYVAEVYKIITDAKRMYGTKLIPIPRPEFFVLYNGKAPYPDTGTMKLSDMFESAASIGLPEGSPALELEVRVININHGRNTAIAERCKTLAWYSVFVEKVREYQAEGLSLEEAIKKAIHYCIEHGILKKFLENNAAEVINMLLTEWNLDDALEVRFEEGFEEGIAVGIEKNQAEVVRKQAEVVRNALAKGYPLETIHDITGLDLKAIQEIRDKWNEQ